jgi:CMP-N,N'-diacetyllegionaminic acid synthase
MKPVALIPARTGSKRIPGKNTRLLAGHPLIAYTVAAAHASGVFDFVAISTDDVPGMERIFGQDRRVQMIVERPKAFASDTSPDIEWVDHFFSVYPLRPEAFAILRPTSPFRTAETIKRAWTEFQANQPCDSIRAVERVRQSPWKMWTAEENGTIEPFSSAFRNRFYPTTMRMPGNVVPLHSLPTQMHPPVFVQNASLEISWTHNVTQNGSISGKVILPFFTKGYEGFDVNTEDDWMLAEALIERGLAKLPRIPEC